MEKNKRDDPHACSRGSSIHSHDDLIWVLIFPMFVVVAVVVPLSYFIFPCFWVNNPTPTIMNDFGVNE